MPDKKKKYIEKRRKPDLLTKWVQWSALTGWIIIFATYAIAFTAKPPVESFVDRFLNVKLRDTWDTDLLSYSFYLMILLLILCIIAFIFNMMRRKRKTDRFNISIILLGIASIIGIIIYPTI